MEWALEGAVVEALRLHPVGTRRILNAVDATNYVPLGWGHPVHAFDLGRLRGGRIGVRAARAAERIQTLDGVDREVSTRDLLICDGEGPVAVAGVMGGQGTSVDATTEDVLVECAYFDPRAIMRTARRLGLHTDSSHRFERGVDPNAVPGVLARVAGLIAELCGGAVATPASDVCWTFERNDRLRLARSMRCSETPFRLTANDPRRHCELRRTRVVVRSSAHGTTGSSCGK